jgi:hypothetical protein
MEEGEEGGRSEGVREQGREGGRDSEDGNRRRGGGGHALGGDLFNKFELALVARTQILMISL